MEYLENTAIYSSQIHVDVTKQIIEAFEQNADLSRKIAGKRKIEQGSIGKRTSLFPSVKNQAMIPLESKLELAYALSLEQNQNVEAYRTQAVKIPYGKNRFLFPDFVIKYKDGTYAIHEIKPSIQALNEKNLLKIQAIENILKAMNIEFRVIDKNVLADDELLQKILFFYSRGNAKVWPIELLLSTQEKLNKKYKTLDDLYNALTLRNISIHLGDYFIFHKIISIQGFSW
ncbi:TnsA endonuclease N-terminal domain-containing protein [Acinetobacter sp. MD2]|uniref:TnsA endonuclease N-terminal domain-containing protein n=1 Tax=Acinetobacter sp. MD2 TaxID=2600066 RepID=UPI002D1F9948|nr:TnsA endonuclease N-terminal domain-containing protein [Acinetobacter sp. MD2]MEB3768105.1 Tn7 transposase TnsA N-terminal domain-containing protein [Acinetobacter sp. MD2]